MQSSRATIKNHTYLALNSIAIDQSIAFPNVGKIAVTTLIKALDLPSLNDLRAVDGRVLSLKVNVLNADVGCYLTRSSVFFSTLGFGNAKLHLHISVTDDLNHRELLTFSEHLKHSGLNKGWQQYLEDNGSELIKELAKMAAYNIGRKVHKTMLRKQHENQIFQLNRGIK